MRIFIDESGSFTPDAGLPSPSIVGALIIPDYKWAELERRYLLLRPHLSKEAGEVKGRLQTAIQLEKVVDLLRRNNALFEATVVEMGIHSNASLVAHKKGLEEGMVRNLTPEHHPMAVKTIHALRDTLTAMKLPGYVQSIATFDLLPRVLETGLNYWGQRVPSELAQFEWVIDAKDIRVDRTPWERWWSTFLLPYLQAQSLRQPGRWFVEADLTYFEPFRMHEIPEYLAATMTAVPKRQAGIGIGKVYSNMRFSPRAEPGLELVDLVTNGLRRGLVGNMELRGWIGIRDLMVCRKDHSVQFISLGAEDPPPKLPYGDVISRFRQHGRPMLAPRFH